MKRQTLLAFTALSLIAAAPPASANPERPPAATAARLSDGEEGVPVILTLASGETLDHLLARVGVPREQRRSAFDALRAAAPARTPRPGDRIGLNIVRMAGGAADLNALFLETGARADLTLVATDDALRPGTAVPERARRTVRGTIGSDLATTLADVGVPPPVIDDAAQALAFEPNNAADPDAGTRFHIAYHAPLRSGGEARLDRITLTDPDGREHRVIPYPARRAAYATPEPPPPARREPAAFSAADPRLPKGDPVPGGRLTSPWGWRIHPVLKRPQFHKGVDYSAPAGTPVLATADGVVSFVGRRGNYGKLIRLQHRDDIATAYAHLKDFASGLKTGTRVRQGQVIGYVGRSGLATGNHLYYEVYADGQPVDPLGGVIVQKHMSQDEIKRLRRALAKDGTIID